MSKSLIERMVDEEMVAIAKAGKRPFRGVNVSSSQRRAMAQFKYTGAKRPSEFDQRTTGGNLRRKGSYSPMKKSLDAAVDAEMLEKAKGNRFAGLHSAMSHTPGKGLISGGSSRMRLINRLSDDPPARRQKIADYLETRRPGGPARHTVTTPLKENIKRNRQIDRMEEATASRKSAIHARLSEIDGALRTAPDGKGKKYGSRAKQKLYNEQDKLKRELQSNRFAGGRIIRAPESITTRPARSGVYKSLAAAVDAELVAKAKR
ncbi:MAG: hypothetical protein EBZ50_05190 [Alphaproteobacteria bacterium]|nr:hypothetical protein [Alphaproteobacteria bacterium]